MTGPELPAIVEMAWGRRERPTKGPKRALSLERIVAAGSSIAATDGLGAVSMSRVAAEVGASTMALYRYVSAKDELLGLMLDTAYGPAPSSDDPDESWRDGLARWAWTERRRLNQNLWVLQIPIGGMQMVLPNNLAWLEAGLWCLRETSLTATQKMSSMLLITSYVRAEVNLSQQFNEAARQSGAEAQEVMSSYGQLIAEVADPDHFPRVREIVASGMFDAEDDPDEEFVFGLDRILDGIAALVESSA
ncbi:MAG TPA: TetR/AcrR family transcriptional regulator [Mycobacteriales bacterium]|nr:TetR/AcrR family transcriptional regulator [Mycobacteriales bacterium]